MTKYYTAHSTLFSTRRASVVKHLASVLHNKTLFQHIIKGEKIIIYHHYTGVICTAIKRLTLESIKITQQKYNNQQTTAYKNKINI